MHPGVSSRCATIAILSRPSGVHLRNQRVPFAHVLLMAIAWTRVHLINARYVMRFASNARSAATCSTHLKSPGNLVPHGGNERNE